MKKLILAMFASVACALGALAQGFPTVSTAENAVWYLIQFVNGGNVIAVNDAGKVVTVPFVMGEYGSNQLWKVEGSEADGYQLTNQDGKMLYVASAAKGQEVKAAAAATGVTRFNLTVSSGNYEIQPKGNDAISMNLTGGPSDNRGVGLWNKGDENNPVKFLSVAAPKVSLIPYPQKMEVSEA